MTDDTRPINREFADRLRALMNEKGMSVSDLAHKIWNDVQSDKIARLTRERDEARAITDEQVEAACAEAFAQWPKNMNEPAKLKDRKRMRAVLEAALRARGE